MKLDARLTRLEASRPATRAAAGWPGVAEWRAARDWPPAEWAARWPLAWPVIAARRAAAWKAEEIAGVADPT